MPLVVHWFHAFLWTLLAEEILAGILLRRAAPELARRAGVILAVNLASHPAVWFIFPELGAALGWGRSLSLLVSEAWAFGLEAWLYTLFLPRGSAKLALATSAAANAASLAAGFALRAAGLL